MSAAAADITWEVLAEVEPSLRRLERLSLWIAAHAPADFCANGVWHDFLKPQLVPLVGWSRGRIPTCAVDGPREVFLDWSTFWERPGSIPATTNAEKMLRTSAAYDIAYDYLYGLLPDCRHGEGTRCG